MSRAADIPYGPVIVVRGCFDRSSSTHSIAKAIGILTARGNRGLAGEVVPPRVAAARCWRYALHMPQPLHVVTTEAMALDPADRLRLAAELIGSVEGPEDPEWTAAWSAELQRRSADADARAARGEQRGVPWEDVRAQVLARLVRA